MDPDVPTAADYDAMNGLEEPFGSPRPTDFESARARARAIDEGRLKLGADPAIEAARREEAAECERQRLAIEAAAIARGRALGLIPPAAEDKPKDERPTLTPDKLEKLRELETPPAPEAVDRVLEEDPPARFGATGGNVLTGSGLLDPVTLDPL